MNSLLTIENSLGSANEVGGNLAGNEGMAFGSILSPTWPTCLVHEGTFASGSFGFNFDLIETNILNLAVVIGVVLYLGGDVLSSLLNDRKQKILGTLKSADERFLEAQQKLEEAKQKVLAAQNKAAEIREQGNKTALQTAKTLFSRTEEEIRRLEEGKQASLRFEEEKALSQVKQQVVTLSLEKAFENLKTKMDSSTQRKLIETNIGFLGKL
jgi:F-type H+-transporting ATPase subunit b